MTFNFKMVRWGIVLNSTLKWFITLQLKPPFLDSHYLFLSPSENFRLPELLPNVPPAVPLDVHLRVRLEIHYEVLTYQPII